MLVVETSTPMSRFVSPVIAATLATAFILFFMARLIYSEPPALDTTPVPTIPPVVFEGPPEETYINTKPKRVEAPQVAPPKPADPWQPQESATYTIPASNPGFKPTIEFSANSSLPFARVMPPPTYPFRAAQRGIEGFVDVSFDITASGATRNIQVLNAEPEGVFEQAAQAAVARWRFQPPILDGEPQPFVGLSKRVRFTLQK